MKYYNQSTDYRLKATFMIFLALEVSGPSLNLPTTFREGKQTNKKQLP